MKELKEPGYSNKNGEGGRGDNDNDVLLKRLCFIRFLTESEDTGLPIFFLRFHLALDDWDPDVGESK